MAIPSAYIPEIQESTYIQLNGPQLTNSIIITIVKTYPYATPSCEFDNYLEVTALLAGSDLTDDGAGEFITSGGEFEF